MSAAQQLFLWMCLGVLIFAGLAWLERRQRLADRGVQFPRDVPPGSQACSVCGLQRSGLVDGRCPDNWSCLVPQSEVLDGYELADIPCRWTPPEIKGDGPATSHTVADCASKFDHHLKFDQQPQFHSGAVAPSISPRSPAKMVTPFTISVPEVHPGDLVRSLDKLFGLPVPAAIRVHPAMRDYLRLKLDRVDAETCPNPFWGIRMHSDREVGLNEVVPMNAEQELAWLRKRDGACRVCGREAPLVDSECPDCRH